MKISGTVQKGSGQAGKSFALPTANIHIDALPPEVWAGVYASTAHVQGQPHNAITFVGQAHLIAGKPWRCETHIFHMQADLVGQNLTLDLLHHIRPSLPFTSEQQAADVIASDVRAVQEYFQQQS